MGKRPHGMSYWMTGSRICLYGRNASFFSSFGFENFNFSFTIDEADVTGVFFLITGREMFLNWQCT